ncbi:nucleotide sugar epimerase [bacterium]|nr:NAD-dependent epimerase/dehydratase family protein [Chloroflexi bacterium CFX6]RIL11395.1 MAG: nucleotide sugar epimerase [bacterium]
MSPATPDPRAPRRCVVTGAAGFIGSHLVDRLLDAGHAVVGVDSFTDYYPRAIKERNLAAARGRPGFTFVEADLRTCDIAPLIDGADTVFHLAAMAGLLQSWSAFDAYLSCNVLATQRLLDAARQARPGHLVHVSTSSVYGLDSTGAEDRPREPMSPYGVTKLAAEHLVFAYARNFDLPVTVLRYFSIYGPRQRPDMGYTIFIDRVLRGAPITIHGDGRQTRGNTYVDDCVDATLAAMAHGPTGDVFNVGGGDVISAIDALRLIESITGRAADVVFGPSRPGEQREALADTSKARRVLGWSPRVGIEAGLRRQVAWQAAAQAAA